MPTVNIELSESQLQELKELTENPDAVSGGVGLVETIGAFVVSYIGGKSIDGIIDGIQNPRSDYGSVDIIGA
jgi:hypothetical protein